MPDRDIVEAIGRRLDRPAGGLTSAEAEAHSGVLATRVANDGPGSNGWTPTALGWAPEQVWRVRFADPPS